MQSNPIRPQHVGHAWIPAKTIRPCLSSVTRGICKAGYCGRCQSMEWILDYSFTPFGRYKVGRESAAWKARPALEAHLYSPHTPYWEDTAHAGVAQTRGMFISFLGGENALRPALTRQRVVRFLDPTRRLGHLLEQTLEIGLAAGQAGFAKAQASFWEIISLLNGATSRDKETYIIPEETEPPPVSDFLNTIRTYFHEHLAEHITRCNLAQHLHCSISALAHRYRAETGESPMTTLTRMRIHVAKSLLLKGHPLKYIAVQTGFCDEYHLSRTFKRVEGMAARDFRRRHTRRGSSLHAD